jgi:hypothetical protein
MGYPPRGRSAVPPADSPHAVPTRHPSPLSPCDTGGLGWKSPPPVSLEIPPPPVSLEIPPPPVSLEIPPVIT